MIEPFLPKPPTPPHWKLLCARLFGKRIESRDGNVTIVGYMWRGTLYIVSD